jgi:hypothetical protein
MNDTVSKIGPMNRAEWIWEFDDDNVLYVPPDADSYQDSVVFEPEDKALCGAMNPYKYLSTTTDDDGSSRRIWPRGYPLELIHSTLYDAHSKCVVKNISVGIYQSFADKDPDVDALYRLTQDLPIFFNRNIKDEYPILIPNGMLSPMNAQAALVHVARASWSSPGSN